MITEKGLSWKWGYCATGVLVVCLFVLSGQATGSNEPFEVPDASLLKTVPLETQQAAAPRIEIEEMRKSVEMPAVPSLLERSPFAATPDEDLAVVDKQGASGDAPAESGTATHSAEWQLQQNQAVVLLDAASKQAKGMTAEQKLKVLSGLAAKGNADAMNGLGLLYYRGQGVDKDYAKAFEWFSKAAQQGHVEAMFGMGSCFYQGHGAGRDPVQALKWFSLAGEKGHGDSARNAGVMWDKGQGAARDEQQARTWYRKGALLGNVEAMVNLAVGYLTGNGGAQEDRLGREWLECAAERGNRAAAYNLGVLLAEGRGVAKDVDAARQWWAVAGRDGHQQAVTALTKTVKEKQSHWKSLPLPSPMAASGQGKIRPLPE
ncbi:Sel1 domain protein repeat-containing protein [Desulfobulbus propionicus DSM 2032]|uniref:Sel1 domain protein repeat-containing protein n=1 Tax=Desulfobulbus propionicus (strain ATCC 33891 / DSM 2032 / VKM B-1956 / 1pr3) TaxID=577650 RepID=A0A7U4DN93_DESPD|nr:tetratricopeptide repeat protein [Desulfobulbus propionicus]ADW16861.1 Sel1 domain protein repeat-containing protein [Desulfobulbus propionicus DSM 2032]